MMDWGSNPLKGMVWGHFDLPMPPYFDLYHSFIYIRLVNFPEMHERGKAGEDDLIECQTCVKKIYVVKKILGNFFLNFFSLNLILLYILNYFYHFQPFLYYKKCAYLKEVIRRDFDQCGLLPLITLAPGKIPRTGIFLLFRRHSSKTFSLPIVVIR